MICGNTLRLFQNPVTFRRSKASYLQNRKGIEFMRRFFLCLLLGTLTCGASAQADSAGKNEVGLVIGATLTPSVSLQNGDQVQLNSSLSFGAEYDRHLLGQNIALLAGVDFLASPLDVKASQPPAGVTPQYAYLFLTPHVRVKFHAQGALQPWLLIGGGYADFAPQQPPGSQVVVTGAGNSGALELGGGVDTRPIVHLLGSLSVGARLEVRDFLSGQPKYGFPATSSLQNNVNLGGGLLLRF